MTPRDPNDRIPQARLEPKDFAERIERAGAKAKHKARRALRIAGVMLVVAVGFALLVLVASWKTSRRRSQQERERIERVRMQEIEEMHRRDRERAKSDRVKELERRAEEIQRRIEAGEDPLDTIDPEIRRKYLPETLP